MGLAVGAWGWEHAGWDADWYPRDLPAAWRLAYFANEFRLAAAPARMWASGTAAVAGQWLEDTGEDFRIWLSVDATLPAGLSDADVRHGIQTAAGVLGDRLGGVLLDDLHARLYPGAHEGGLPVLAAGNAASPDVYRCIDGPRDIAAGTLDDSGGDLGWLRGEIEAFLAAAGDARQAALFVTGQAPRIETVRNAQVIADLLAG